MKKNTLLIFSAVCLLLQVSCNKTNQEDKSNKDSLATADTIAKKPEVALQLKWTTDTTLTTCESVLYDSLNNILYVSNINKNPAEKDNNGFISKVSLDGKIENLQWVTGLSGPKGMGLFNGKLYVTDVTALVEIDIAKGKIVKRYEVPGAIFLNDVTISEDGAVYFSDSQTNKIYIFKNGEVKVWKEVTYSPNGLLVLNNKLYLASRDTTFKVLDIDTKEDSVLARGVGAGDGVVYTGVEGEFIVSNWKGQIFYVKKNGETITLLDTRAQNLNTADITFVADKNLVLVPTFAGNKVQAYELMR